MRLNSANNTTGNEYINASHVNVNLLIMIENNFSGFMCMEQIRVHVLVCM